MVALGAGVLLAGCSDSAGDSPTPAEPGSRSTGPTQHGAPATPTSPTSPTSPAPADLPAVTGWRPDPHDLEPQCKLTAVRRVETAGNGPDHALQVIDAQYGGLLAEAASVLVVTRSWARRGGGVVVGGHTFDVRLSRTATGWRVTDVRPSHPGPSAAILSTSARRVLASDRIELPPTGTLDVRSGNIHDSVLKAMLTLSASYRIHVSVVRTGHPLYVFGTNRRSDHPQGRAFDTWAIDGQAVVDARSPRRLVEAYMHAAADAGAYNVGGPYLLGAAPQFFSDDTHHDHVHAGFAA
jgi:hypothetical protein